MSKQMIIAASSFLLVVFCFSASLAQNEDETPPDAGFIAEDYFGFQMVYVPAGTFEMGISESEFRQFWADFGISESDITQSAGYEKNEGTLDAYTVRLPGFWIDRYEVTIEKYLADDYCISTRKCNNVDYHDYPEFGVSQSQPHFVASWFDAMIFCNRRAARLPTEEEWEYAASGSENFIYPWGNKVELSRLNLNSTYPVGTFADNVSWAGVYDMSGNAEEWVEDRWTPYSASKFTWTEWKQVNGAKEDERVIRGGRYSDDIYDQTTYARRNANPFSQEAGFRCVRLSDPRK